jgi:HTH-type transcriptional regulator/antitoxin HigA
MTKSTEAFSPAEAFPPGEFIRDELEARDWTQEDLAEILGCSLRLVNEVIKGRRAITIETARRLGDAFGTGAQFWLNLETSYQLWRGSHADDSVARRSRLYAKAPVKDMIRRRWIEPSHNVDVLEQRVLSFLEITTLDDMPSVWSHAARKPTDYDSVSPAQWAWLLRAKKLARLVAAGRYIDRKYEEVVAHLKTLLQAPPETRQAAKMLAEVGIRLLVVEPLPRTKIDGATFWLDRHSPVIAISHRYDRIDWFWHTLMHEMEHVRRRDGLESAGRIDVLFGGPSSKAERPESEVEADTFAAESLVPQEALDSFIARVGPLFSKKQIRGFAALQKVHPGIVVGQLQYRGAIAYAQNREMLIKVREAVTSSALTDGWGHTAPTL